MSLKQHELSAFYPAMPEDEFQALAESIKANGLRESITLYKGDVLDGWHRYRACIKVGAAARFKQYSGSDPAEFVRDENGHRRHLTASQRALIQVQLSAWLERGKPVKSLGARDLQSAEKLAEKSQTSVATVERAKTVATGGTKELKDAVKDGGISIEKAAKVAKLPKAKQAAAIKAKPAKRKAAKPKAPKPEVEVDAISANEYKKLAEELTDELADSEKQIENKDALIESLQTSDLAKEVTKWANEVGAWIKKYAALEGRLAKSMKTEGEARKSATYYANTIASVRKLLRVTNNADILPKLKALV